LNLHKISSR